ncbi:MAG: hypothetical protein AB1816_00650 [Bacillota bacterium]
MRVPDARAWTWSGCVKTQYAGNTSLGHFLRRHTSLCRILVEADRLGILDCVGDEGGFWGRWDVQVLVREAGEWDLFCAGIAGAFREAGVDAQTAVAEHPEYSVLRLLPDRELGKRIARAVRECQRWR